MKTRPKALVSLPQWELLLLADNSPKQCTPIKHHTIARNLSNKGYGYVKGNQFFIGAKGVALVR